MRESIEQMRARHQMEIDKLQGSCKHSVVSNWMPFMFAPGHFSHNVKVCRFCGKIVEEDKKSNTTKEGK